VYERNRNIVLRADGKRVNVARFRGQLFVCSTGCCCGRTEDGFAPVPAALFHEEWERRRLRNIVHLTVGGCLGPCGLANVVHLLFDGQSVWFHSVNSPEVVREVFEYVEGLLSGDCFATPEGPLASHHFTAFTWQPRADGKPVDDRRLRVAPVAVPVGEQARGRVDGASAPPAVAVVQQAVARMDGVSALPRKNGELVFEEPWHGRAFGMAIALYESGRFQWEEFRQELIAQIRAMEQQGGKVAYYEAWLAALENVLAKKGIVGRADIEETTYQFEFGERDDVY